MSKTENDMLRWGLRKALDRVNDLEIIIKQAQEMGLTLFLCGDQWPKQKAEIEAILGGSR